MNAVNLRAIEYVTGNLTQYLYVLVFSLESFAYFTRGETKNFDMMYQKQCQQRALCKIPNKHIQV